MADGTEPKLGDALKEALTEREDLEPVDEEMQAHDALTVIAESMVSMEKHLFALVYLSKTNNPEKTGVTYVDEIFNAIYDDTDPFAPENMPQPTPDAPNPA